MVSTPGAQSRLVAPPGVQGLRLIRRLAPFRRSLVVMSGCLLVQTIYWIATPLLLAYLVDDGLLHGDRSVLTQVIVILTVIAVLGEATGVAFDRLSARVLAEFLRGLRQDMFDQLQRLSFGYYTRNSEGDIVARFSSDVAVVEELLASFVPWVVLPGLAVAGSTVALFALDWRLALLAMLVWPASLIGPRLASRRAMRASMDKREAEAAAVTDVQENVAAQPVVRAFVLGPHFVKAFGARNRHLAELTYRSHFASELVDRSSKIGNAVLQIAVLACSAVLAFDGVLSIGQLTAFQALFLLLGANVDYVMQYLPRMIRSTGGVHRIDSLLRAEPDADEGSGAASHVSFDRDLSFDHVTFSHSGSRVDLDDVSFTISKGSYVAFVGASGCGKSTVLSLLMRMYDPEGGAVRIDGTDIREVRQDVYRSLLAPVLQESFLFDTSVRENIRMGRLDASDPEIEVAARAAEVDDAVRRLPGGYASTVGPRGQRLSGGERQRVAIARAILSDPAILVLDEATSALDAAAETSLNETLTRLAKDRTVVNVTHRLASVVDHDRIFVLHEGRLVEDGRHEELLALDGVYAGLWSKQAGFHLSPDGARAEVTAERLAAIPVFSALDHGLLADLAGDFTTERWPPGRVVVYQDDPADRFYVIVRGTVTAARVADDGTPLVSRVLQDGDYFGEVGLLHNVPRTATVRTDAPTVLLTLNRERFSRLLERVPELRDALRRDYPELADGRETA